MKELCPTPGLAPMRHGMTRCHGTDCQVRQLCLRHTAPVPDNVLLSWASTMNPERAHLCEGFIANTRESD